MSDWRTGFEAGRAEVLSRVRTLEGERDDLKALVATLALELDAWGDSKDSPELTALIMRARKAAGR